MTPEDLQEVGPNEATEPSRDLALSIVVAVCSLLGVGAFLAHAYDLLPMPFTISVVSIPAALLVLAIGVWAGRLGRDRLLRRLWTGLVAGLVATLAYDLLRALIALGVPGDFDPFRSHPNFGAAILDTSADSSAAMIAGWTYHFWNGISFGVAYAVIGGGRRWPWALLYAMVLETATLIVYPRVFDISRDDVPFVVVSFLGHAAYGTTLGILLRDWLHPGRPSDSPWSLGRPDLARAAR